MSAQSARGLFRATGNKPKRVVQRLDDGSYTHVDHLPREKDEFYPTPPEPSQALVHYEGDRLRDFPLIWEPATGNSAIASVLRENGLGTIESDIVDRGAPDVILQNFYDFKQPLSPCIVTNPPYAECNARDGQGRWIIHSMKQLQVEYMALLLSWGWPGAAGLGSMWSLYPPSRVYLMRWKIDFTGQGAPPMLNGWFVWDCQHKGETVLRMMDRVNPAQASLL